MQDVVSDYPFLFLMFFLLWWCMFGFFSLVVSSIHNMNCWFILSKHVLNFFIIVVISFLFSKICMSTILFLQNKNRSTSPLEVDLNFPQIKNWSTSSWDANLKFFLKKKYKLICIFIKYRSDFFYICGFWNKEKDHAWLCLLCLFYLIHAAWIYFKNEILFKKKSFS